MSPGGKIGQCRSKCLSAHPSEVLPVTVPSFLWGRIGFEETLSTCRAQDLAGARRVLRTFQNRQLFQHRSRGSLAGKLPWACGGLPETCPALTLDWVVSGFLRLSWAASGEGPCAQRSLGEAQIPGGWGLDEGRRCHPVHPWRPTAWCWDVRS